MAIFKLVLALLAGYLLGSVNTGIIVGYVFGVNIRKKGSGNAGLTNVFRVLGAKAALVVLIGDVLKSVISCVLGYVLTAGELGSQKMFDFENPNLGLMLAGTSCILGHVFPVFFQFVGGKGVLTAVTTICFIDIRIAGILLALFVIILLISRYVSLSSIIAAIFLPVVAIVFEKPMYCMVYMILITLLIIIMHRKNIGRLINGTESKIRG